MAETAETAAPELRVVGRQASTLLVLTVLAGGDALGLAVLRTVVTTKTGSMLEGPRRVPAPPDLLDVLTQGCPAALVGSLFPIAGSIVAHALVRADKAQVAEAPALPLAA